MIFICLYFLVVSDKSGIVAVLLVSFYNFLLLSSYQKQKSTVSGSFLSAALSLLLCGALQGCLLDILL